MSLVLNEVRTKENSLKTQSSPSEIKDKFFDRNSHGLLLNETQEERNIYFCPSLAEECQW
jgi:hypothetical protein